MSTFRRVVRRVTPDPVRRQVRTWLKRTDGGAAGSTATSKRSVSEIDRLYLEAQTIETFEEPASDAELGVLSDAWQDDAIPDLQRRVVDAQLANLERGVVDPVFTALATALTHVELERFSILDAACASGYYSEVIRLLDPRPIAYEGCDYSPAMIESAQAHHPGLPFSVEDLTALTKADRSVDVVLLSGVLEHIPEYRTALAESVRVARDYLIVHRCPTQPGPEHVRTIGTQYNVRTPRTFFSAELLTSEVAALGFDLVATVDVYPKKATSRVDADRTLTFVFRRSPTGS